MPHPVTIGKRTRMSFSKIKEIADVPNLIELQVDSYKWFIEEGLKEVFEDISPIEDYTGNLILEFVDYSLDDKPKYDIEECKDRDATYCAPLKVKVRLINKETGEIKEQEVFMGDFPLMTEKGTFVINGAERVIVSQLVRSPGVYYALERDKTGKKLISSTVIPNRGAWLEYETDSNDVISVRVDRTRKQPVTVLLRALGIGTNAEIIELLGEDERLMATLEKDNTTNVEEGLVEIYKKLRPGEPPTVESASSLINALFFDAKRYDLAKVGRYKFNKKLALAYRIMNRVAYDDIINPETGEVFVKADEKISYDDAWKIQNSGINTVTIKTDEDKKIIAKIKERLSKIVCVEFQYEGLSSVMFDRQATAQRATEYLIQKGFSEIGYIGEDDDRVHGVQLALSEKNLDAKRDNFFIAETFDMSGGFNAIDSFPADKKIPRAIVCGSDEVAIGVLRGLSKKNISVPNDVAIISIDNIEISEYTCPPLTTMNVQKKAMGEQAVKMIVSGTAGKDECALKIMLPSSLIVRESC